MFNAVESLEITYVKFRDSCDRHTDYKPFMEQLTPWMTNIQKLIRDYMD